MARTVLPIVGAVVGAYFGAPQIGYAIGAVIGNAVDPVKVQGPRLGETGVQTSAEGAPRAIIYGTISCTGNIIAAGALTLQEVETQEGKGGGPVTSTQHGYRTYAIRICEGPIDAVLRIWEDDKLVYDVRPNSPIPADSQKWFSGCTIYLGDEAQLPDPDLETRVNSDMPAYRGTAYMVFPERDLTDRRGSIPQYRFEVTTNGTGYTNVVGSRGQFGSMVSADGDTWASSAAGGGASYITTVDGRFVGWETTNSHPQYTTDYGATWQQSTGVTLGGTGGRRVGWGSDPVVMIPTGVGIARSMDRGSSFSTIGGAPASNLVTKTGSAWITYEGGVANQARVSPDDGNSWGTAFHVDLTGGSAVVAYSTGYTAMIAGTNGGVPGAVAFMTSAAFPNTISQVNQSFPSVPGATNIRGITGGIVDGQEVWVAATDNGRILRKAGMGGWTLESFVMPNSAVPTIMGAAFNGKFLLMGCIPSTRGVIISSPDGTNWTVEVNTTSLVATEQWEGMAAIPPVVTGGGVLLSEIVADIHDRCDIPAGKFDVSELTDEVAGLLLAGDYTGADAINTLRAPYFFDGYNADKKIWYPKRGHNAVFAIDIDDLVEDPDLSKREQAIEYQRKYHLQYQHANSGYAIVKATSTRSSPDAKVVGETTLSVPVVLDENQAAQTVQKMHKVAWAEADGEIELSLPDSFLKYTPTDVGSVTLRGQTTRRRIHSLDYADGIVKWKMKKDRQSAYTSEVEGVPIPDPTPPPSNIVGETILAVMDIPSRADFEDDLNIYYGVTGAMPAWYGAVVQRSLDAGANYTNIASISTASVMGYITASVADADEHLTDRTNTIHVTLYRDLQSLESITNTQFLSEGGAFALEKPDGSWEIMQYRDCVEDSNGNFTLSTLHRGRLNSGTSSHDINALFVMLDRPTHIQMPSSLIGQSLTHRAPSFEQSPELASEQTDTYFGRSQIEWPVASFNLTRDGSNVVTATWAPRHRFGTSNVPVASINFQGFRVTKVELGVTTIIDQSSDSYTVTTANPVTISVSSLNRITGPGPVTSGTI